jgi:hypothetical protein
MKRFTVLTMLIGILAVPGFAAAQAQRANAQNQQSTQAQARLQNQVRMIIGDLYVRRFSQALELTDEQFLKTTIFIRSFIENRFRAAMQRENINRQLEQLQSQPNPSKEAVDDLVVAKAVLDSTAGGLQSQFLAKIRPHLTNQQVLAFFKFNQTFFEEDLPDLIDSVRESALQARPNQNAPLRPGLRQ